VQGRVGWGWRGGVEPLPLAVGQMNGERCSSPHATRCVSHRCEATGTPA
jgi:hypothetical protein